MSNEMIRIKRAGTLSQNGERRRPDCCLSRPRVERLSRTPKRLAGAQPTGSQAEAAANPIPLFPPRNPAIIALGVLFCANLATAVDVSKEELAESREWTAARLENKAPKPGNDPGLFVAANHDAVQKNGRGGKPMNIAGTQYSRGLYCHAFSRINVRLPSSGESFTAIAGVDSNEQTGGGRGTVDFSVSVEGEEKFRSGVMREGMAGKPVKVDLGGRAEFVLQIDQTPDGISCDQSDWAEAKVTLKNGRELWLADLPLKEVAARGLFDSEPPFSFTLGGNSSVESLKTWEVKRSARQIDEHRTEHTLIYSEGRSGLQLRCVAAEYHDFPTVEWTLYFKNTGTMDSAILENIRALDVQLDHGRSGAFLLHHNIGSPADGNDYGPLETSLKPNETKRIGGAGGRPSNSDWPYFNLAWGDEGILVAVGWPGQWRGEFVRDNGRGLHLLAGQELTHLKLRPGEEVRSPLVVLQFWKGDWIRAQNIWRRWMMAYSMPRPGGKLPQSHLFASSSRQYDEMIKANETNQIMFIDRYAEEGIRLDYWWMDAGWYEHHGGGWPRVGTWLVDSNRFPHGLRGVSDHAHQRGLKVLVWFEPERVTAGTWLAKNHPEWVLGGAQGGLLNLGNDDARRWLTDHIDRTLTEQGIDLYRQDFNMDPLSHWRGNDAPDRQGITENKYVTGFLAFWDELRRRHPTMLIDSCASGGRRNDIETMRRAVPLWRSDYAYEAIGHQCMTYGLSMWLPFHGTGTVFARNATYYGSGRTPVEPYGFWSNASQLSLGIGIDMRVADLDYASMRQLLSQWREVSANYYGDFYPLTPWTRDDKAWMAWQFDRPESGEGLLQVFRRHESIYEAARLKLCGLRPEARYSVRSIDAAVGKEFLGRELINDGLPVSLTEKPAAAILIYRKVH